MTSPTVNGSLLTSLGADSAPLVNPDGTGTVQFRQLLRSFKRVSDLSDPGAIAALQAQITVLQGQVSTLQTQVATLQTQISFAIETEAGP